jgi:hypothetical protein
MSGAGTRIGRRVFARVLMWSLVFVAGARAAERPWVQAKTPHFTVLTNDGEKAARQWAVQLEQFRRAMQLVLPVPAERVPPVHVLLFRSQRELEAHLPLIAGRPAKFGGIFVRTNDASALALALGGDTAEVRQVIFHEAAHWHLQARDEVQPVWLAEGLAETFSTFEPGEKSAFTFGRPLLPHVELLRRTELMPFGELFAFSPTSAGYDESRRTGLFYAQLWALVHFLLYGEQSPGAPALAAFLDGLKRASDPEVAFRQAFGGDYRAIRTQLANYVKEGRYRRHTYAAAPGAGEAELRVGAAAPGDVALARGIVLSGVRRSDEAERWLLEAGRLAPDDARVWAQLGYLAGARKDRPAMRTYLERAVAAGSRNAVVFFNLAVSRLPERDDWGARLGGADVELLDASAADFRRALALRPDYVDACEGLAGILHVVSQPAAGDADLLAQALRQRPGSAVLAMGRGVLELRAGRPAEGRGMLGAALPAAESSEPQIASLIRAILAAEVLKDDLAAIEAAQARRDFAGMAAIAARALERDLALPNRATMLDLRRRGLDLAELQDGIGLAQTGRPEDGRLRVEALLAREETHHQVAAEARAFLRALERSEEAAKAKAEARRRAERP